MGRIESVLDVRPITLLILVLLIPVLFCVLSYFVYAASLKAAMAVLSLGILFDLSLIIALIPFCGFIIQIAVMALFIQPWTFRLTGLYATWLTEVLFMIFVIIGIIITGTISLRVREALVHLVHSR